MNVKLEEKKEEKKSVVGIDRALIDYACRI